MSATVTAPEPVSTKGQNQQRPVHCYVRKADFTRSLVNGVKIAGLCGRRFRVRSSPETAGTSTRAPLVCPDCAALYAQLPHPLR